MFLSRHRSAETQCSRRRTDRTWYVRSAKCTRVEVQSQFCKMEDSIENAATTTNQPLSHQLSLENRRVSDRLRRQGESDEQRQESQEEHDQRLQRRRERDALARQEESQEQHEQRLERRRVSDRFEKAPREQ